MNHDLLTPIQRCPVCGAHFPESGTHTICASCGAPVDHSTVMVEGTPPAGWPAWQALSFWIIPMSIVLAARLRDAAIIVMVFFLVHAAIVAYLALVRARRSAIRLFLTSDGIASIGLSRSFAVEPYHLFDEVRMEAQQEPDPWGDGTSTPRWRLTIVNAYKPSISVYLHSRGTDLPIFCNSIDLIVAAEEDLAIALKELLQRRIENARAAYRATRLREVDQLNAVRRRFRRRSTCPKCGAPIEGEQSDERCPRCRAFVVISPDQPRFALEAAVITWNPGVALATVAVAALTFWPLLTGAWIQTLPWLILAAGLGIWSWFRMAEHRSPAGHQVLVTKRGLELWNDDQCEAEHTWHEFPTLRYVQLERGAWRIALWRERTAHVTFSPFLFTWFTSPRAIPAFDIVLSDIDLPGRMICEEIAARHAREHDLNAHDARLHLDRRLPHDSTRRLSAVGSPHEHRIDQLPGAHMY